MARARRLTGRAVRGTKNQVWTVSLVFELQVVAAVPTIIFSPVTDPDWVRSNASAERATLLRMRGWMSVRGLSTTFSGGAVMMYALLSDDDAPIVPADVANTYAEEDILWTGGTMLPDMPADASGVQPTRDWDIDVKSQRKFRAGEGVDFVMENNCANSIEVSGVIRALVRMGGN